MQDEILMQHNVETYENAIKMLTEYKKVAVVQPTGTGKSYIAMKILKQYKDKTRIVIGPSRDFLNTLEHNKYWEPGTITITYQYISKHYNDTDSLLDIIGNFEDVGIIVLDELHRAGAPTWRKAVLQLIDKCENTHLLGLTATPIRHFERKDMVADLFNGYSVGNMSLGAAIDNQIIPKLNYVVCVSNIKTELNRLLSKYNGHELILNSLRDTIDSIRFNYNTENMFKTMFREHIDTNLDNVVNTSRHIIFTSSVEEANEIEGKAEGWFKDLYKHNRIKIYNINSRNTNKYNQRNMVEFTRDEPGTVKVAIAIQMLSESFHFSDLDSISMIRKTQSPNVFIQQIGRGISAVEKQPVIFDFVDNFSQVGNISFKAGSNNHTPDTVIFDKFIDETDRAKTILSDLESRIQNRIRIQMHRVSYLTKKCGTIYDIQDSTLRNWGLAEFKHNITQYNTEEFELTAYIHKVCSESYYENYKLYIAGKLEFNGEFKTKTLELLVRGLLHRDIRNNIEDKLGETLDNCITDELLYNNIRSSFKGDCKLGATLYKAVLSHNIFECYQYSKKIQSKLPINTLNDLEKSSFVMLYERLCTRRELVDAHKIVLTDYESALDTIISEYRANSSSRITEEMFKSLNENVFNTTSISENTQNILSFYNITLDKAIDIVDNLYGISSLSNSLRSKYNTIVYTSTFNERDIQELKDLADKFTQKLNKPWMCEHFKCIFNKYHSMLESIKSINSPADMIPLREAKEREIKAEKSRELLIGKLEIIKKSINKSLGKDFCNKLTYREIICKYIERCRELAETYGTMPSKLRISVADRNKLLIIFDIYNLIKENTDDIGEFKELVTEETLTSIVYAVLPCRLRNRMYKAHNLMLDGEDIDKALYHSDIKATLNLSVNEYDILELVYDTNILNDNTLNTIIRHMIDNWVRVYNADKELLYV